MSEYIVSLPEGKADDALKAYGWDGSYLCGYELTGEVVRCRDCVHYYEAEEYHPQGNYDRRCCKYFGTYDDEVEPDGFCAWGEKAVKRDATG